MNRARDATLVAQICNLLYRRFPIGRPHQLPSREHFQPPPRPIARLCFSGLCRVMFWFQGAIPTKRLHVGLCRGSQPREAHGVRAACCRFRKPSPPESAAKLPRPKRFARFLGVRQLASALVGRAKIPIHFYTNPCSNLRRLDLRRRRTPPIPKGLCKPAQPETSRGRDGCATIPSRSDAADGSRAAPARLQPTEPVVQPNSVALATAEFAPHSQAQRPYACQPNEPPPWGTHAPQKLLSLFSPNTV